MLSTSSDSPGCEKPSASASQETASPRILELILSLESSLQGSQRALLCGDAQSLEQGTLEQIRLTTALRAAWQRELLVLSSELQQAGIRVLHRARVQAAVLRRSQQSLAIWSNLLAGPGANYGPRSSASGSVVGISRWE